MRRRALIGLLASATSACGRLDFDRNATDAAAPADATMMPDAAPPCVAGAPFGVPVPIAELNTGVQDGTLRLLPDELSAYYWSGAFGAYEIYFATRPSLTKPFTSTIVQGINTATDELDPAIASDGSVMVFRRSGPGDELYVATRIAGDTFSAPASITSLNTTSVESQAFMPIGRDELYFHSSRTGAGDIYVSLRTGPTFGAPTLIGGISGADDGDPVVTPDGLTIYFRSDRPEPSVAGYNIYTASRPTPTGMFGAATLVPNVNTDQDDGPSWISPDDCRLYLSSRSAGTNDIYVATRGQ